MAQNIRDLPNGKLEEIISEADRHGPLEGPRLEAVKNAQAELARRKKPGESSFVADDTADHYQV